VRGAMRIRRTKVTVVTEHVFTFTEHRSPFQVECETCGAPTRMISLNEASSVSGISPEAIRQQVEASGLHFTASEDGALFICFNSLLKLSES
jgi:hypothetical protein